MVTESGLENFEIERERARSIRLTSPRGEIIVNRLKVGKCKQTWIVDADLDSVSPTSWKVRVEDKNELLSQLIPEILFEGDGQPKQI